MAEGEVAAGTALGGAGGQVSRDTNPGEAAAAAGGEQTPEQKAAAEAAAAANGGGEQTPEQKAAAEKEAADKAAEEAKKQGAPEAYEDFTLPDEMPVDAVAVEGLKPLLKELNLSQEQAQKLVSAHAEHVQGLLNGLGEKFQETTTAWLEEAKTDKEIGGDKYDESVRVANRAIDVYGNDKLREVLETSGLGNHPELIRAFAKAGAAVSEDTIRQSGNPGGEEKTLAQRLYPEQK